MKALVTGASRGIGRATAKALAAAGAELVLVARDEAALRELARSLPRAFALPAELARPHELASVVDRAADALGDLDVLVNCAGIVEYAGVLETEHASLARQLDLNFVAPFLLAQRTAAIMRERGHGGCIVNVASTLGLRPAAHTAAYAATKAALLSMTRSFALELGPHGIRVNAVAPGIIDTDMIRARRPEASAGVAASEGCAGAAAAQLDSLARLHLLGRLGTPEEVADAVLYLLGADFVTGSVLVVDGGISLQS